MDVISSILKGMIDIIPENAHKWQALEQVLRSEAQINGFEEIRTPVAEQTGLFLRGVGDTTDVVEKQMYTFDDKGGRSITLRPEGTAGAVRAMLENGLYNAGFPVKLYYNMTCYRYEKPQAGRLREYRTFGVEMFGTKEAQADAQIISMAISAFKRLGLEGIELVINSIGCPVCRAKYHEALTSYFQGYKDDMCETCHSRLERNPMRILDCKSKVCAQIGKGAPVCIDYLCDECNEHFKQVKSLLDSVGIEYSVDPFLVRGLDYYTRTVFEFLSTSIGAQCAIGGGGRYDGLVEQIGGKPMPGLGFGLGSDRIMLALEAQKAQFPKKERCELYIASMTAAAQEKAFALVNAMHTCGIFAECDVCARGLKAQMKYAGRIKAKYSMVIGDSEMEKGRAEIKNMDTGEKTEISIGGTFIEEYAAVCSAAADMAF